MLGCKENHGRGEGKEEGGEDGGEVSEEVSHCKFQINNYNDRNAPAIDQHYLPLINCFISETVRNSVIDRYNRAIYYL